MTNPTYRGEAILLRWGESSANGRTVTFQIGDGPDDAERHPFYGLKTGRDHGQRFALVAVPLAENENDSAAGPSSALPLPADTVGPETTASGAAGRPALTEGERMVQLSGILANDPRFQEWAHREGFIFSSAADEKDYAAKAIRVMCGVSSRSELATNNEAANIFKNMVARFKSETGQATWEKPR